MKREDIFQKAKNSVFDEKWPIYDEKLTIDNIATIVVQVNGKHCHRSSKAWLLAMTRQTGAVAP